MLDQLRIGDKYSYDDFLASVAERKIGKPKKKEIKETVPYSNKTHDFSKINGEIYWEERELEYILELDADTPEELEELKRPLNSWLMNVVNEDLYDPFIEDYHFKATYKESDDDDSEVEKTTMTVKFTAYPYMLANDKKVYSVEIPADEALTVPVKNISSHRITPTFNSSVPFELTVDGLSFSLPSGEITSEKVMLEPGINTVKVKSTGGSGTLKISYIAEVF